MSDLLLLALAAIGGLALGLFFFGGLWWTVRRGVTSRHPALLFTGSLVLRLGVTVGGLWLLSAGDWQRLAAGLIGLLLARWLVTRWTRPASDYAREERRSCS